MILILIALIAVVALSIYANTAGSWDNWFTELVAPIIGVLGFVGLVTYAIVAWSYFAAEHKKNIINREYGTNYTQVEVFYASDVINTVRELDRKRIELNGDLITGK